jgi:phasin
MAVASKRIVADSQPEAHVEAAAETASAEAFAPVAQVQETVRLAVEKGVAETRAAYARAKAAVEETTGALESSYSTAAKGAVTFNTKALEALRVNAESNFDFVKAVINAKSISEYVALQSEHASKLVETMNAQTREIAALAQEIAANSVEPIRSQVVKTFRLSA